MTVLYLLRHARSAPDPAIAEADWPLSAEGRAQARWLVGILADLGISAIVSSPYRRCLQTVTPFARATGIPLRREAELRERSMGSDGIAVRDELLLRSWRDFSFTPPGGESLADCQRRMVRCLDRIAGGVACLLVASHGNAIASVLHGIDPSFGYEGWRRMRNPDLFRLRREGASWRWDGSSCLPVAGVGAERRSRDTAPPQLPAQP